MNSLEELTYDRVSTCQFYGKSVEKANEKQMHM